MTIVMKKKHLIFIFLAGFLMTHCADKQQAVDLSENPPLKKNTHFKGFEDLTSPKFSALREKYQLDTVVAGETDEFKRQLLLRDWIRSVIQISDFEPSYPGGSVPEEILDNALQGQGYHCGHYMVVQNAVMNAFGYVTRCLGAGPGVQGGPDGHHGINEIWSNKFQKWYMSDAKYNHHFEKDGIPLSALEIRDEYLKDKAAGIVMAFGPERTPIDTYGLENKEGVVEDRPKQRYAQTYTWVSFETWNDRYTNWPDNSGKVAVLTMYEDDYFKNNTWIWGGKPHWAYAKEPEYLKRVSDRNLIEWTPNTISAAVQVEGGVARVNLDSETPNLKTYQMKRNGSDWEDVNASVEFEVNGDSEVLFRTVNLVGVSGPEYAVTFR